MNTTTADEVAEYLDDDPTRLASLEDEPRPIEALCEDFGGTLEHAVRVGLGTDQPHFVVDEPHEHVAGDPVRYRFADGSALVIDNDRWHVDAPRPFDGLAPPG